ncbi:MAG TPA: HemK/PrmC family methyltransferase [Rhodanobacteraceae bacterium]|nr:HemK/PrmC family methyltransferase [Rhodanobacteraceae bacterium]
MSDTERLYRELHGKLAAMPVLADKPEENADTTLRALWHTAAGHPKSAVAASNAELPPLREEMRKQLEDLVARRLRGVPLAHLTGRQHFLGLELISGPGALVPRRETELLAEAAIALARAMAAEASAAIVVVDVCSGSGNIALAIARAIPAAKVCGADLSEEAVDLARRNAAALDLADRVRFEAGDLLAPFDSVEFVGRIDLLTCNPPYISSTKVGQMADEIASHEPRLAFDGGPLGVTILMRLLQDAPRWLSPGGWLAFEVGAGQGGPLVRRLRGMKAFCEVRELTNEAGEVRAVLARRADGEEE